MFKNYYLVAILLFLVVVLQASAQDIKPEGVFLRDSVKIGETVSFSFSYKDRRQRAVVFPDSLYDFSPFELVGKDFFNTQSDSLNSVDSAVYYLTTFEIDKIQRLSLPVFVILNGDSLPVYSVPDSIRLTEVVTQMPDSVTLQENTHFQPVALQFNYPYLIIALVTLGVILLIILFVYGKEIRKRVQLYRLKKKLEKFKVQFEKEIELLQDKPSKKQIEQTLKCWKLYMEGLEKVPYTKLTTREVIILQQNSSLEGTLKSIDRNIYSKAAASALQNDFDFLKDYAIDRYNHRTEVIKNA